MSDLQLKISYPMDTVLLILSNFILLLVNLIDCEVIIIIKLKELHLQLKELPNFKLKYKLGAYSVNQILQNLFSLFCAVQF